MFIEVLLGVVSLLVLIWSIIKRAVAGIYLCLSSIWYAIRISLRPSGTSLPSSYTPVDIRNIRLRVINVRIGANLLRFLFKTDTANRPRSMSLWEFYEGRGVAINKFKKSLSVDQRNRIDTDPEGDTFDVTLLYRCLRGGGSLVLASEHDDKWKEGNGALESLITTIKHNRNVTAHEEPTYSTWQFLQKSIELRKIFTDTLNLAGQSYNMPLALIHQEISNMNSNVNKYLCDDLMPQDFEEYKKQLLFPSQQDYVKNDGKKELKKHYGQKEVTIVTPVNHLDDINFEVKDVFTEMRLIDNSEITKRKDDAEIVVELEDVFEDVSQTQCNQVILVEGIAGTGKTTLVKKILSEWMSNPASNLKELGSFDLLLHVECRNPRLQSCSEVLRCLMPETSTNFKSDDMVNVILSLRVCIILDGLDELNSSSERLFQELLHLKKDHSITLLVTTRPEKLEYFSRSAKSLNLKVKHIVLMGIPLTERDTFVSKYYMEMKKINSKIISLTGLLSYLERTGHRLEDVWRLPYNLTILVLLWVHNPSAVNTITTDVELYWQMYMLYQLRIKERLLSHQALTYVCESLLKRKIQNFMTGLSYEALKGLMFDRITIVEDAYQRLEDVCIRNDLPPDEMIGAFLKKMTTKTLYGYEVCYNFPHKGFQEFLGALYILSESEGKVKVTTSNVVTPTVVTSSPLSQVPESTVVIDIMKQLHGSELTNFEKYQNLLAQLIGLMHLKSNKVGDDITLEILKLLQQTGIENKNDWLRILNSVKCNEFIASFISQQHNILKDPILVDSTNLFAYISVLKALQPPITSAGNLKVNINVKGDAHGIEDLLLQIDFHGLLLNSLLITDENAQYYAMLLQNPAPPLTTCPLEIYVKIAKDPSNTKELFNLLNSHLPYVVQLEIVQDFKVIVDDPKRVDVTNQVLQKCPITTYLGAMDSMTSFPTRMEKLHVSIKDASAYNTLNHFMHSEPQLKRIAVCISSDVDLSALNPLHYPKGKINIFLYITNAVTDKGVSNAVQLVRQLNPPDGCLGTNALIAFPRASLTHKQTGDLLKGLKGISLFRSLCFPEICKPKIEEEKELQELSMEISRKGISWGNNMMCDTDDW